MNMNIDYTGGMQFIAETRGHKITVDLPPSYNGEDTGPTPPELFVASLGSCIGVYTILYLKKEELPTEGVRVEMSWEDAHGPSRIGKVTADIHLPEGISAEHAQKALQTAAQCKVHNTLRHTPEICVNIANRPEICLPG